MTDREKLRSEIVKIGRSESGPAVGFKRIIMNIHSLRRIFRREFGRYL